MSPAHKHTRRWLQFSLGTMFIAVTVVAGFLAYHVNWVRQRHELIARQQAVYLAAYEAAHLVAEGTELPPEAKELVPQHITLAGLDTIEQPAPRLLRLLGEQGIRTLMVIVKVDEGDKLLPDSLEEFQRAKRLFPEAAIVPMCVDPIDYTGERMSRIWKVNDVLPRPAASNRE